MLTLKSLPWRNLKGFAGRAVALFLFAALMAVAVFGGTVVIGGVRSGLDTVKSRLGADIMVTPESAKNEFDAQTVLLKAEPGYFYMDSSVYDEILEIDGVDTASPQLFMCSAKAGCCSVRVQFIAFDPETDFTVQPWMEDTDISKSMNLMDVVIGSNVSWASVADENVIRFYDNECTVIGQFAPTGSTLDSAVYMTFDTVKALIQSCKDKGMFKYENLDADKIISSVMIRIKPGYDIDSVAAEIRETIDGVSVATSTGMVSGIADSLSKISGTVSLLTIGLWVVGLLMTILIFTVMIHERKREFASLYAMGASRKIIAGIVTKEALILNMTGGIAGVVVSAVILLMFKGLIGQNLGTSFVLPSAGTMFLLAFAALFSVLFAAAVSSRIAVKKISKTDASLVLREGE